MRHLKLFEDHNDLKRWKIYSGLGGGFGGAQYVETFSGSEAEAEKVAYNRAIEEYESYEGLHGLRTSDQIEEEDGVDADEAERIYEEERESWLDYYVRPDDGKKE
jgi:hypothetical protein